MSLFSLPLAANRTANLPQKDRAVRYKVTLPVRKRKRPSSPVEEPDSDDVSGDDFTRPPASTNPLSLAPAEIIQYNLAGLALDKELPDVQGFPHRGLKAGTGDDSKHAHEPKRDGRDSEIGAVDPDVESREDVRSQHGTHEGLRLQHFKVLVALLHQCLQTGDVQRALRAWSLLLRLQFKGDKIDIRSTGYWAIGAELLVKSRTPAQGNESDREHEETGSEDRHHSQRIVVAEWGSQEGRDRAVEYLAKLILEFPDDKLHPDSISAVDFWLSMLAIEIYGIQFQQRRSLSDLAKRVADMDVADDDDMTLEEMGQHDYHDDPDERAARRRARDEEETRDQRDNIRQTTLTAAQSLAVRVDDLLNNTLYTNNVSFLEIRAHLALYIGELSVPERLLSSEAREQEARLELPNEIDVERKLRAQQRLNDYNDGMHRRATEIQKVKALVERIVENRGTASYFQSILPED